MASDVYGQAVFCITTVLHSLRYYPESFIGSSFLNPSLVSQYYTVIFGVSRGASEIFGSFHLVSDPLYPSSWRAHTDCLGKRYVGGVSTVAMSKIDLSLLQLSVSPSSDRNVRSELRCSI